MNRRQYLIDMQYEEIDEENLLYFKMTPIFNLDILSITENL